MLYDKALTRRQSGLVQLGTGRDMGINHQMPIILRGGRLRIKHYTEKGLPPADAEALFKKENSEYQFFISARILSLASSTFMRERIKVMMASSTKGITRYMSFSILMQDSGCTASALS